MIILPLSPAGDLQVMAAAAKAGIPVITPLNSSTSKYVVGVQGNAVLEGAKLGQALASALGRKGTLLDVHGIPGVQVDTDEFAGANQVLKNCPQIKTVGSVVGGFVPSVAKTQTLQFLASHPAAVDSVFQAAGMATGIIQAFQQTGRKVPTIVDVGGTPGALAYWNQHKGSYHGVALGLPPAQLSTASWNVMMGLLAGRGLKVNQIEQQPLMITNRNLAQWLQPGWTLDTPLAYAPGPKNALLPPSYLNQFFGK
jgi:ribose transport system substrate-binding protein